MKDNLENSKQQAQRVLRIYNELYSDTEQWQNNPQLKLAAALLFIAEMLSPEPYRTPWLLNEDGYFNETLKNCEAYGELNICLQIKDIAEALTSLEK